MRATFDRLVWACCKMKVLQQATFYTLVQFLVVFVGRKRFFLVVYGTAKLTLSVLTV